MVDVDRDGRPPASQRLHQLAAGSCVVGAVVTAGSGRMVEQDEYYSSSASEDSDVDDAPDRPRAPLRLVSLVGTGRPAVAGEQPSQGSVTPKHVRFVLLTPSIASRGAAQAEESGSDRSVRTEPVASARAPSVLRVRRWQPEQQGRGINKRPRRGTADRAGLRIAAQVAVETVRLGRCGGGSLALSGTR